MREKNKKSQVLLLDCNNAIQILSANSRREIDLDENCAMISPAKAKYMIANRATILLLHGLQNREIRGLMMV